MIKDEKASIKYEYLVGETLQHILRTISTQESKTENYVYFTHLKQISEDDFKSLNKDIKRLLLHRGYICEDIVNEDKVRGLKLRLCIQHKTY